MAWTCLCALWAFEWQQVTSWHRVTTMLQPTVNRWGLESESLKLLPWKISRYSFNNLLARQWNYFRNWGGPQNHRIAYRKTLLVIHEADMKSCHKDWLFSRHSRIMLGMDTAEQGSDQLSVPFVSSRSAEQASWSACTQHPIHASQCLVEDGSIPWVVGQLQLPTEHTSKTVDSVIHVDYLWIHV